MTLIQVSRIWALVLKDAKTGGFLWIGHWSTPETCCSPSIFWPKTLKICPKTSFPTGTLIGDQVFSTESHLLSPSVESIAIPLTIPFSRIWSASMTTSLPFAFFERTLSASYTLGTCWSKATSTTTHFTETIFPSMIAYKKDKKSDFFVLLSSSLIQKWDYSIADFELTISLISWVTLVCLVLL